MDDYTAIVQRHCGTGTTIDGIRPVHGGDINVSSLLLLSDGSRVFLKENSRENAGFFEAERTGLEAIRKSGFSRVPKVLGTGVSGKRSYLMLEYLEEAPAKKDFWARFGRQLANMHRADTTEWTPGGRYGFTENNYIGAGKQINKIRDRWVDFFRENRLEVQFHRAEHYFSQPDTRAMLRLLDHLEDYLTEPDRPSLLHGDLWGGNYVIGPDAQAWLIDPAVSVGHAEADLAMSELFGGFSPAFYDSYREVAGPLPGYAARRDLYNLYHLLNHLNLFGGGYYGPVMRIIRKY